MATQFKAVISSELKPLLKAVHAGPHEEAPWSRFTEQLRAALGVRAASFSFRLDDGIGPGILACSPMPSESIYGHIYNNGYDAVGPPPGGNRLIARRLYGVPDFLDRRIPEHAEFERRLMIPQGLTYMRVACVPVPSGGSAWLSVGRDSHDFSEFEEALLEELLPHLEISLLTYITIERERARSSAANEAVRKLDFCWLKLNAQCQVVDKGPHAESVLRRSPAIKLGCTGGLVIVDQTSHRAMLDAVALLAQNPGTRARALHISDDPWLDMLVVPLRDRSMVDKMEPAVVAYLHGEAELRHDRADQLADLFDLTASEAALTLAICRGQSIREAAGILGVTEASAREYSKRIYAKTGARGQADLVRLVLTSVVALA